MDVLNAVGSGDRNVRSSRLKLINLQLTMLITQDIQKQNTIAFCQNQTEYQYTIHASSACLSACCSFPHKYNENFAFLRWCHQMAAINGIGMNALVGIIGSTTAKKISKFHSITACSIKPFSHCLKETTEIFNVHAENKTKIQSDL
jgi:hypothetical protein